MVVCLSDAGFHAALYGGGCRTFPQQVTDTGEMKSQVV